MLLKNKLNKMKSFLNSDNILSSLEECYCYANDASNTKHKTLTPDLVVFVESIKEVQKVLKYANTHEIPIIARGAGTNMVGACVSTQGGIILNFSKMKKILEINTENLTARVQPGVILGDLKQEVENLGLFYPPDPSNYKVSTIGGSIAQSSGGAMSFKYGTTKDYVLSLKVVTANGDLMTLGKETSKNALGYHLAQLMVGSEGTLAIIVEATLKLIPKPESNSTIIGYFNDIHKAVNAIGAITTNGIFPSAIDFMDKNSMITIEEFLPSGLKTNYLYSLLINLDGLANSMPEQIERTYKMLLNSGAEEVITPDNNNSEKILQARRASYAATTRLAPDVISDDIIVPRNKLAEMILKCNDIAEKYSLKVCLVGHVGDGNIHPQFVLDLNNEEQFRNYCAAKSEIYEQVKVLGGSISAEHGIGLEKLPYLSDIIDKISIEYMKSIKKVFDPKNILNPDKIFSIK